MADEFSIPEEYALTFRRFLPYLAAPLQNRPEVHAALLLYLKVGGEKLVRAAIDAFNVRHRLEAVELMRLLREESMNDDLEDGEDDDDDGLDEDEDDDNESDDASAAERD